MTEAIRIVHLEDEPLDAELIRETLAQDGLPCHWTPASSGPQFEEALESECDLILADYRLPGFDGRSALRIAQQRRPGVPFIFVSGTMGEETAVERLRDGATDCVLKQRLDWLPEAVRRALREANERRERQRAEGEVLRLNEALEHRVEERTAQLELANRELQMRQTELDDAKAFLEHLLAASPSMVFRLDPETFCVSYVSPNVGWLLGYSTQEVVGVDRFWEEIIHPDERPAMLAALRQATSNVVAQIEQECRLSSKDGRYRWFFTLFRIEYDHDAHPIGVLGYALDIADRKAAEEQVRQSRSFSDSIVENLPALVLVKDARDLTYVAFNRAAEETLGLSRTEVIGRTDFDLFPPALAESYAARDREVVRSRMPVDIAEEVVATRGREPRVLHTKKIPVLNSAGEPVYVVAVSIDITELRSAHEEVRLARLEAERASRAKSDFLSRMSHDLRTPLNAVLGFAQILQMDELSFDQAEAVEQIRGGGVHLLELINEVLDIARIEAGQLSLSPEPVPVADVITQVANLVRPLGTARKIVITADVGGDAGLHVRADRQRLKQVLMNLVSNAVKYNRDAGVVRVSCERQDGKVRLLVSDTGAGISAEKLALLFQPFERLGAEQSAIEGTGLGLAVAKGLTEAMGGRIGITSEVDVGSTFWVELPQSDPPAVRQPERSAPVTSATAGATGTVLYVEDNRSNIRLLERLLGRRPGIRLRAVSTGEAALASIRTDCPHLILLDLHLPDMSGEEVLRRIWAEPSTRSIPVAVLSADATVRQQQRLIAAGAVAYPTKPLDVAALLRVVDERLAGQKEPR